MKTTEEFIETVRSALGTPYLWGGVNPFDGGADCSGLMVWAAAKCGVSIARTSQEQWRTLPHVSNPRPGDLILFNVPSDGSYQPAHVGMYLGPGKMIEAPYTGARVRYSNIPNMASEWVMGYVRIQFSAPIPIPLPPPLPPEVFTMDDNLFVRWCYQELLVRPVDPSGFEANMAWLKAGGPRWDVYAHLYDSPEGKVVQAAKRRALGI